MGVVSTLSSIENEYNEVENSKSWKLLFANLRTESEELNVNIEMKEAKDPKNKTRNRYRDVLPYDHSRVPLKCSDGSDYINASYVELNGFKDQRRYILTQGPLNNTVSHFWRMVWTEHSTCIVMLNKIIEKDIMKCAQYFPVSENEVICHEYEDFSLCLSLIEIVDKGPYVIRVMLLVNKITNEERRITQYHYLSWPDFGVPLTPVSFLEFLWDVRSSSGLSNPEQPCIIHCSAGIGRSGTFVLIDLALLQIADSKCVLSIDLKSMLLELRKCRMGLVQAAEQLKFAYMAIIVASRAIESGNTFKDINFDSTDNNTEHDSVEEASSSEMDTDSDFSDGSDIMHSNSALDNAAAAVRSRRGLPPTNGFEDTIVISQRTDQKSKHNSATVQNSTESDIIEDRRQIREMRFNRTREKIEEIRTNMRAQDLERNRFLSRLGLKRLMRSITGHSRNSFIMGASVAIGVVSAVCGMAVYKYAW